MMTIKFISITALLVSFLGLRLLSITMTRNHTGSDMLRSRLISIAAKEVGVRESTGQNDGPRIHEYQSVVKLKSGEPYCAAFVCWTYAQAGLPQPRSGWSPALFPASRLTKNPAAGDVFGIYFLKLKRIAHVGLVIKKDGDWVETVEGNTNLHGSRQGLV